MRLRERLVPYLADQARRSAATGMPLMRALCFDWPGDPAVWAYPGEYLLGDALLVAPVTRPGATEWEVYLPEGTWIDAWTGERRPGPGTITRAVPIDVIPVYIRVGADAELGHVWEEENDEVPA